MGFYHTMALGETLADLARQHALAGAKAIHDAPQNAELRRSRATPESIKFGDSVYIPTPEEDPAHTHGGMSGNERVPPDLTPQDSDPEMPPNTPLADEAHAIVAHVARNLLNTIDIRPGGHAWFSA